MSQNSKQKVLVVDDERTIADTLAIILRMEGYEAESTYSGECAVARAVDFRPEVVVSDIRMGVMDGIEASERIRKFLPGCRVVLFSASMIDPTTRERILASDFEFLSKPLRPELLITHLREGHAESLG